MRVPFSFIKATGGGGGGGSVPVITGAPSYTVIDPSGGGKRLVVPVDDSSGCTAISADGVAFTSFAIDDATHVSGIPGAHAAGVVDLVVTNATGDSTTGTGLVEYWTPTVESPSLLVKSPDYAEAAGAGTWTAAVGSDLATTTGAPAASDGAPLFTAGDTALTNAMTLDDCLGAGDCHAACVVDLVSITGTAVSATLAESVFRFGSNAGFYYYRTGATGSYQYFAAFYQSSGEAGDPTAFNGFPEAVVEITSLVDASGAGRVVLQGRKTLDKLSIKADGGAWVVGADCYDAWTPGTASSISVGTKYADDVAIEARVPCVVTYPAAKGDAFADDFVAWAAGLA